MHRETVARRLKRLQRRLKHLMAVRLHQGEGPRWAKRIARQVRRQEQALRQLQA